MLFDPVASISCRDSQSLEVVEASPEISGSPLDQAPGGSMSCVSLCKLEHPSSDQATDCTKETSLVLFSNELPTDEQVTDEQPTIEPLSSEFQPRLARRSMRQVTRHGPPAQAHGSSEQGGEDRDEARARRRQARRRAGSAMANDQRDGQDESVTDWPARRRQRHHYVRRNPSHPREVRLRHRRSSHSATLAEATAPPTVYSVHFFGRLFSFQFSRTSLNGLVDRVTRPTEILLSVLLATSSAYLGFRVDHFYNGLSLVVLWAVVASTQFSLLKSVQPDPASSSLDDRASAYSRPLYFCIFSALVLAFDHGTAHASTSPMRIYGIPVYSAQQMYVLRELMLGLILFLPLIHVLGLLPRGRTLIHHLAEQIDLHCFGGGGTMHMAGGVLACIRSVLIVAVIAAIVYASLANLETPAEAGQEGLFSFACGMLMSLSFLNARLPSDPAYVLNMLPGASDTARRNNRLHGSWNLVMGLIVLGMVAGFHMSGLFAAGDDHLFFTLAATAAAVSALLHFVMPECRNNQPLGVLRNPVLGSSQDTEWITSRQAQWFERVALVMGGLEEHILYPALTVAAMTRSAPQLLAKFDQGMAASLLALTAAKLARSSYISRSMVYVTVIFTLLFFQYDFDGASETFLLDAFVVSILISKFYEFLLKVRFVITYTAPWNIKDTWGSTFHAFIYPFHLPHTVMLLISALVAAVFSAPLYPFRGSSIFLVSYMRPLRFWEREYKTKHMDQSNTKMATKYDAGARANNLNSLFYHHQLHKLQEYLSQDIAAGRFGSVQPGDVYILLDNDNHMTSFLHIMELGGGFVGFQLRGLEFTGTFCQAREVEALEEDVRDKLGCCCFSRCGGLFGCLALNTMVRERWQTWRQISAGYVLPGYSISLNPAGSMFQSFELIRVVSGYFTRAIIYFAASHPSLDQWLENEAVVAAISGILPDYVDLYDSFNVQTDPDFDIEKGGISLQSFCEYFGPWLAYCWRQRPSGRAEDEATGEPVDVPTVIARFCFLLAMMGRRLLQVNSFGVTESFLTHFQCLFNGDIQPGSSKDDWVYAQVDILEAVIHKAIRLTLRLHQDHFTDPHEYNDLKTLYDAVQGYMGDGQQAQIICSETDPAWAQAVFADRPSLLSMRYNLEDSSSNQEHFVVMLTSRHRSYKVFKVNSESVRGFWAGQQQEVLFLREPANERGSIQNAKTVLRNLINQSCDQPVGYPIFVSELSYSFSTPLIPFSPLKAARWLMEHLLPRARRRKGTAADEDRYDLQLPARLTFPIKASSSSDSLDSSGSLTSSRCHKTNIDGTATGIDHDGIAAAPVTS